MFIKQLKITNFLSFVGENVIRLRPFTVAMNGSKTGKADLLKAIYFVFGHELSELEFTAVEDLFHDCLTPTDRERYPDLEVTAVIECLRATEVYELTRMVKCGRNRRNHSVRSMVYMIDGTEVDENTYRRNCLDLGCAKRPLHFSTDNFYSAIFNREGIEIEYSRFWGVDLYREELKEAVGAKIQCEKSVQMGQERLLLTAADDIRVVDSTVDDLEAKLSLAEERSRRIFPRIYESRQGRASNAQHTSPEVSSSNHTDEETITTIESTRSSEGSVVPGGRISASSSEQSGAEQAGGSPNIGQAGDVPMADDSEELPVLSPVTLLRQQESNLEERIAEAEQRESELLGSIVHTQIKLAAIEGPSDILRERAQYTNNLIMGLERLENVISRIKQELQLVDSEVTELLAEVNSLRKVVPYQKLTPYGRLIDWLRLGDGEYLWLLEHVLGKKMLYGHLTDDPASAVAYVNKLRERSAIENFPGFVDITFFPPKFKELIFDTEEGICVETIIEVLKFFFELLHLGVIDDVPYLVQEPPAGNPNLGQGKHYIFLATKEFVDADGFFGHVAEPTTTAQLTPELLSETNRLLKHQEELFASLARTNQELIKVQQLMASDLDASLSISIARSSTRLSFSGHLPDEEIPNHAQEALALKATLENQKTQLKLVQRNIKELKSQLAMVSDNLMAFFESPLMELTVELNRRRRSIVSEPIQERFYIALGQKIKVLRRLVNQDEVEISKNPKGREYRQRVIELAKSNQMRAKEELKMCAEYETKLLNIRRREFRRIQQWVGEFGSKLMQSMVGRVSLPRLELVLSHQLDPWRLMLTLGDSNLRDIMDHNVFLRCLAVLDFFLVQARARGGMLVVIDEPTDLLPRTDADALAALLGVDPVCMTDEDKRFPVIARISLAIKDFLTEIALGNDSPFYEYEPKTLGQVILFTKDAALADAAQEILLVVNDTVEMGGSPSDDSAAEISRVINFAV